MINQKEIIKKYSELEAIKKELRIMFKEYKCNFNCDVCKVNDICEESI